MLLVREVFGADPDAKQCEVLTAVQRGERRISIVSGHGVGKTTTLAWCIICHALTRFPQKTVCTAPTSAQLFEALAAETKAWIHKLPEGLSQLFNVKTDIIELIAAPQESFVTFRTSRPETPEALAGVHSENVLLIGDEASGIPEQVFEAAAGSMSGHHATTLLAGNPVRSSGLFYDTHHTLRDQWRTIQISCIGHPRIADDFIADMRARYGEDSNAFRVRVLGLFPKADDDTVVPNEWVMMAEQRDIEPAHVKPIWGLDVARFGSDRTALCIRRGNAQQGDVEWWVGKDLMQTAGRVKAKWDGTPDKDRPSEICIDAIGLGSGVSDRLRELGLPARAVNVSEAPAIGDKFRNLRAQLWWETREWFERRDVKIADKELATELIKPKYRYSSTGKIEVESKDEMKKRGMRSPDIADSFVLTFATTAISALHGDTHRTSWKTPLKRAIKGLV